MKTLFHGKAAKTQRGPLQPNPELPTDADDAD
jgi:hypothetical protein